ncbi:hypothetical protein CBR_g69736 [Chara braunii]|uniref:Protein kinase domain-containing protein n=1 Tax=Chara braunii TaxID=69332 RepID=A0A388MFU1_CHABU|nr:hypothetical protein CBR_g69736 [Chara braunii]|eukprot:GBG93426.1 hypothetical protein CBR_g69736 [Chara braunii]
MEILQRPKSQRPDWLEDYELVGKIGEGTYGLVYLARNKDKSKGGQTALKKFKQSKEGDGVSPTAIREIMLLRECQHENVVKLVNVHINHFDSSLYLAFDYAEHDLYEIIRHHREKLNSHPISLYTVKSLLWQILNGLNYLHSNWIIHRDLKPSNILVMGQGDEEGVVKIGDFGLARIFQAPLKNLSENGVVVTIWYRAPELLLGSKHYTTAVDMWAVGCIFAELLTLKPLFQGQEDKNISNPLQADQLDKIFRVLGMPTVDLWPNLERLPHWQIIRNGAMMQKRYHHETILHEVCRLPPRTAAFDLLSRMLDYDPAKRLTAAQALEHDYFRQEPLPGRNSLVPPGDKAILYPQRPVDMSIDPGVVNHPQVAAGHHHHAAAGGGGAGIHPPHPHAHAHVHVHTHGAAAAVAIAGGGGGVGGGPMAHPSQHPHQIHQHAAYGLPQQHPNHPPHHLQQQQQQPPPPQGGMRRERSRLQQPYTGIYQPPQKISRNV